MQTDNDRIERYRSSEESIQNLFASPESGTTLSETFKKYNLDEELYKKYAQLVGDVILGFYKIVDLPQLLQKRLGVSADEAQRITSDLIEFLSPVAKQEEREVTEKKESLTKLADSFKSPQKVSSGESLEPAADVALEKVEPIRTMQRDATRIHGYGSVSTNTDEDEPTVKALDQDQTLKKPTTNNVT